jgi:4-hydroxy-tetrahydrodipicolinate synthase
MFAGTHTALVTPFQNGVVDEGAFRRLIEGQIAAGINGLIPVGTTGESATLDHEEHAEVIRLAVQTANKRAMVIAGTGSNSTKEAVELTVGAQLAGADAVLVVAPYYNKPTQEGVYRHYRAIAAATKLPIMLYSIPGRCGIEIAVETCVRLATDCPNILAIKEAGGSAERVSQLRHALPETFAVLSGDDSLTLPFMALGAVGVVSVASNVVPKQVVEMVQAANEGRFHEARAIHYLLYPLFKDLFIEANPGPAKAALHLLGQMNPDLRAPLCEMQPASLEQLRATLRALELIA